MYSSWDLALAALTGVAVVGVTLLGDRLGGRLGGLVATAPVTTSGAHVVLATSVAPGLAAAKVLAGVQSLLAVTFAIPAFFYAVKLTKGRPSRTRLFVGLAAFLVVFIPLVFVLAAFPPPHLSAYVLLFALHAVLAVSFMREPVPAIHDDLQAPRARRVHDLAARFLSGFLVVLAIRFLIAAAPPLAGALAVVPAVFLVSLTVLGLTHNAPFAARASQAGVFGATAVGLFVLVIAGALHWGLPGGIWAALPFAWAAYLGALWMLGRVQGHLMQRDPRTTRAASPR